MQALIVTAPGSFGLQEVPMPQPGAYDCLVKIDACAICTGTDSDIIAGTFPWISPYPFILGHESTGVILSAGEKVRHFQPGQRVTRPAAVYGGEMLGAYHSTWGGYAEYGLVRDVAAAQADGVESPAGCAASRTPLPEGIGPVEAALSINQREILSVTRRISFSARSRVVIIGSGYNGLLFALLCKQAGAGLVVVVGSHRLEERATRSFRADALVDYHSAQAAQRCLELTSGRPTNLIDAIGSLASLALAEAILQPGTAFGCYGVRDFNASQGLRDQLNNGRPTLEMGTDEAGYVAEWHDLYRLGVFDPPEMVDRVTPFEQAVEAFELLWRRQAVKIVLKMGEN